MTPLPIKLKMRKRIGITHLKCNLVLIKFFYRFCFPKERKFSSLLTTVLFAMLFSSQFASAGVPNGTWLSQPQIRFYSSNNALDQVMREIKSQQYQLVFLDFRGISDEVQQKVAQKARSQKLIPVVWVQSPQYRSLSVAEMIQAARYGDGIQLDDHFFSHYSPQDFQTLSLQYKKFIFCSIQPFQASVVPKYGCNQLDVQCYSPQTFRSCLSLADRLNAVVSLSDKNTFRYRNDVGERRFNVFLWPYTNGRWEPNSQAPLRIRDLLSRSFSYISDHVFGSCLRQISHIPQQNRIMHS